eukprot:6392005-Prymnesium_polylepis.1
MASTGEDCSFTPDPPQAPPPPPGCADTCLYSRDGDCDDGGPGAEYADCPPGTDCTDCGVRAPPSPPPPPPSSPSPPSPPPPLPSPPPPL